MGALDPKRVVSTRQQRIAALANRLPGKTLTSLNHHIDMDWLREAFRRTRKDGAVGIDGQTAEAYAEDLEANLADLLERCKSGRYVAPPVKRVHIPKGKGATRPIGMTSFEDKVLQRAIVMVLEPIYEREFLPFSYGYRPGRSAHDALEDLWQQISSMGGCWLIDADISKFFDSVGRSQTQTFLQQRVTDGVVGRLVGKWLRAGVMEDGEVSYSSHGTAQGGVVSPLLSNIYLHEVLDRWFVEDVEPRLSGRAFLIRFADDFVMGFEREEDARRVMEVLRKRFTRFGLTIHPTKTRLIDFRCPPREGKGESFEFLGFTHYWGRSRNGRRVVKRKTAAGKMTAALQGIRDFCRRHRHLPLAVQSAMLASKLTGHYQYYGITGNGPSLSRFQYWVERAWFKWLSRRSRKRDLTWARFRHILKRFPLPRPRVVHSIYRQRQAKLPFEEPCAGNLLARVCGVPGR